MGPESSDRSTAPGGAGFISYASEDATAAERIASAPRSAGIEVWLDQSELRGGGAWDRKIRKEIALFIPIISANAHAWDEGYFRLEWKLGADRSRRCARNVTNSAWVCRDCAWVRLGSGLASVASG